MEQRELISCWWRYKLAESILNSFITYNQAEDTKDTETPYLKTLMLTCQDTCMYEKVPSSINCDSPKVEMSHVSANWTKEVDAFECQMTKQCKPCFHVLIQELQWQQTQSSWPIPNPERWCCESAALNMPAYFENSAVATGLEKVRFHSNPKERQCQRMLKLPHNCTHLTR